MMIRIYRFSIWPTEGGRYLFDGLFTNATEAVAFIRDNRADPDVLAIRVDAIDYLDPSYMDWEQWSTDSDWWHPHMMEVPA
jgi:hypothetical protein